MISNTWFFGSRGVTGTPGRGLHWLKSWVDSLIRSPFVGPDKVLSTTGILSNTAALSRWQMNIMHYILLHCMICHTMLNATPCYQTCNTCSYQWTWMLIIQYKTLCGHIFWRGRCIPLLAAEAPDQYSCHRYWLYSWFGFWKRKRDEQRKML